MWTSVLGGRGNNSCRYGIWRRRWTLAALKHRGLCYHMLASEIIIIIIFFFFFFHRHYSPLWALACRIMSFHFFLSATNSLYLLTPSTWRSLSTSSFHLFLGLPILLVPSSSWVTIFLGNLPSSILSRWPNQLILCPFIHFTIYSPLLISSSSRFVRLLHSPFSYLGSYILLNISLSTIRRSCNFRYQTAEMEHFSGDFLTKILHVFIFPM